MTVADAKLAACGLLWLLSLAVVGGSMFMAGRASVEQPVPENVAPAPESRQPDDSLILERRPDPSPSPAPHKIPPGHVEERRVSVVVQSRPGTVAAENTARTPDAPAAVPVRCRPVRIDLSLVRDIDGGRRVIASSPDGRILGGLDVPIVPGSVFANRKWAIGASYDPFSGTPGAWVERDMGRLRVGADLYQERNALASGLAIRLRVGWTF